MSVDQLFKDDEEPEVPDEPNILTSDGRKRKRRKTKEQKEKEKARLIEEQNNRDRVKRFVMTALGGTPEGYSCCRVKYVNDGNYRVNVHSKVKSIDKIAHSFYVRTVKDGFYCRENIPCVYDNLDNYLSELQKEEVEAKEKLELDLLLNPSTHVELQEEQQIN